ncbi:hypothetical protein, partial [Paraburkholderia caribensis]|uniref:hypothetical protein n=1 Tax=Paraburkholderia caribensis TaxID=75105 RepID=UPI002090C4B4
MTASGAISHESADVIGLNALKRNRLPTKPGKEEFTHVAQTVKARCGSQTLHILKIRVKELKL